MTPRNKAESGADESFDGGAENSKNTKLDRPLNKGSFQ